MNTFSHSQDDPIPPDPGRGKPARDAEAPEEQPPAPRIAVGFRPPCDVVVSGSGYQYQGQLSAAIIQGQPLRIVYALPQGGYNIFMTQPVTDWKDMGSGHLQVITEGGRSFEIGKVGAHKSFIDRFRDGMSTVMHGGQAA